MTIDDDTLTTIDRALAEIEERKVDTLGKMSELDETIKRIESQLRRHYEEAHDSPDWSWINRAKDALKITKKRRADLQLNITHLNAAKKKLNIEMHAINGPLVVVRQEEGRKHLLLIALYAQRLILGRRQGSEERIQVALEALDTAYPGWAEAARKLEG